MRWLVFILDIFPLFRKPSPSANSIAAQRLEMFSEKSTVEKRRTASKFHIAKGL
jgi:hypothetical protein